MCCPFVPCIHLSLSVGSFVCSAVPTLSRLIFQSSPQLSHKRPGFVQLLLKPMCMQEAEQAAWQEACRAEAAAQVSAQEVARLSAEVGDHE